MAALAPTLEAHEDRGRSRRNLAPPAFRARPCHSGKAGARRGPGRAGRALPRPPKCKYAAKIDAVGSPRDERSEEAPTRKERQGRSAKSPACRRAQGKFVETQGERQAEGATKGSE